ncbi:MAG: hypothetical protein JWQ07_1937 [Ramlibacter sp.]|nr:hypothetical protein [Ramlibacter sp.]
MVTACGPLVAQLLEGVLNANSTERLAQCAGGKLAVKLTEGRLARLHELFPSWSAAIDHLVTEQDSVIARYRVTCVDAFGLLGPVGPVVKDGQAFIAQVSGGQLIDVRAVVDDFGIWAGPSSFTHEANDDHCPC